MATLNKVMLIGRLTKDPDDERTLPKTGTAVISFRLAVGRSRKNPETGQWENDPNPLYIDCDVFGTRDGRSGLVEVVKNYLRRGSEIYVEGRLQFDEWENRETGKKQSKHKLIVTELQMLGGRQDQDGGRSSEDYEEERPAPRRAAATSTRSSNGSARKPLPPRDEDDAGGQEEDIPF